ncbi:four-carbon acid sugar kinase family protein [Synechococcus sp. M16CYN]|uniref:four-carbon acid sugar kinase family protein n=1 Tax=Synechococcus sp. M16CYN TaxID=3103139 RepID=UPI0030E24C2D
MKIVVIDDDPTGSQTVHGCPLLLRWDVETVRRGLRHASPLLFLLADTRALKPSAAALRNREIAANLDAALVEEGLSRSDVQLVSRGDSTLRGHGTLEPATLEGCFGPFAATLHVPAFLEGGRTTVGGVHLLHGEPVHTTPFAQDRLFGFTTSYLPAWLEQKSAGAIKAADVVKISCRELNQAIEGTLPQLIERLACLQGNVSVVVDIVHQSQLDVLADAVLALKGERRFLFRSAASLLKALADLGPQPLDSIGLAQLRRRGSNGALLPGMVMVGSHVPLADHQLKRLLGESECTGLELPVRRVAHVLARGMPGPLLADLERVWQDQLNTLIQSGGTPVVFTSRDELTFASASVSRRFSCTLARLMGRLASAVAPDLGYLISKGGLTTQTLLAYGLGLEAVQLEGQFLPGLSLVRPSGGAERTLPILTFPGNLGASDTLLEAWQRMQAG